MFISVPLLIVMMSSHLGSPSFYVDKVIALSKYDSRFIFRRENAILPLDTLVTEREVACFTDDLRSSGLFKEVSVKAKVRTDDTRTLFVTVAYHDQIRKFTISDIVLVDFPEIDQQTFLAKLRKKGVMSGTPLLRYYFESLERKINTSLRESLPSEIRSNYQGSAWIAFSSSKTGRVRLTISPKYKGCGL